jgi:hypothetical protein
MRDAQGLTNPNSRSLLLTVYAVNPKIPVIDSMPPITPSTPRAIVAIFGPNRAPSIFVKALFDFDDQSCGVRGRGAADLGGILSAEMRSRTEKTLYRVTVRKHHRAKYYAVTENFAWIWD